MPFQSNWQHQCETESLALSGAIQPHGALIYLDRNFCVQQVSENIARFLTYQPLALLGKALPEPLFKLLAPTLSKLDDKPGSRLELFAVSLEALPSLDIIICRGQTHIILELFPHIDVGVALADYHIPAFNKPNFCIDELHELISAVIMEITGFRRVMVYAFREDGDGEVIAESRHAAGYGSYLGLRFPASDIPNIARTLYLQNPWRMIPDSQSTPIALLSLDQSQQADLTWSDLRSVSPVHQIYLANMGVRTSLSFPIVVSGKLWGLIACHHAEPRCLPLSVLRTASNFIKKYNLALTSYQAETRMRFLDGLAHKFSCLHQEFQTHQQTLTALEHIAPQLMLEFNACGLAIRLNNEWRYMGQVPNMEILEELDEWFEVMYTRNIFCSDNLQISNPGQGFYLPVAGALAIKLAITKLNSLQIWLFRHELIYDVAWGGNPQKPIEYNDGEIAIAPRRSFEKWVEKRIGYCSPWQKQDHLLALWLLNLLAELFQVNKGQSAVDSSSRPSLHS